MLLTEPDLYVCVDAHSSIFNQTNQAKFHTLRHMEKHTMQYIGLIYDSRKTKD